MNRIATAFVSLVLMLIIGAVPALGQTNFTVDWERSVRVDSVPGYMSEGTYTRGFAVGAVNDGSGGTDMRALVPISGPGGENLEVSIVDATDGMDTGNNLNLQAITSREWEVRDLAVTDDGQVIGCKLTTDDEVGEGVAEGPFACWRWQDLGSDNFPLALEFDGSEGYSDGDGNSDRLGVFTATGSFSDNSLTLWVAEQNGTQVHRFEWDGSDFNSTVIDLTDGDGNPVTLGTYPKVTPKGTGAVGFYLNSDGTPAREFNASGVAQRNLASYGLTEETDAITWFTEGGDEYLMTHIHSGGDGPNAMLVNVSQGGIYGLTTDLSGPGNGIENEGDVVVEPQGGGNYTAYVLTSRAGLGAVTTAGSLAGFENPFVTEWDSSETANGTVPNYMSSGTFTRGFAAGTVNDGQGGTKRRVLVPISKQSAGLEISIVDDTGMDTGNDLNLDLGNTIPDREWAIRDVDVTEDGNVIGCKLTTDDEGEEGAASGLYRCYRWQDETAGPTELQFDGSAGYSDEDGTEDRLGVFTTIGSFSDNSLTLWAAEHGRTQVHRFEWDGTDFNSTVIDLTEGGTSVTLGGFAKVAPKGTGASGFFLNSADTPAWEVGASGSVQNSLSSVGLDDNTEAITRFTAGGDTYLLAHSFDGGGAPDARIVNVSQETTYGLTTPFGVETRKENDVSVQPNGDGTFTAYVLTSQDGIGAFRTTVAPLPVEMASFGVQSDGPRAVLSWQTASETNNAGFNVQHQGPGAAGFSTLGFVESKASGGTATQPQSYRYTTGTLTGGTHTFRLRQVDTDGSSSFTETQTVTIRGTAGLRIGGANPIGQGRSVPVTVRVNAGQAVEVALYDVLGRRVRTVVDEEVRPGQPLQKQLSTGNLSSGVYFLRASGESLEETRRLTVVR